MSLYEKLSILVGLVGFGILVYQLRKINHQNHSNGLNYLYTQSASIRLELLRRPELIPYFRNGDVIAESDKDYGAACLIAELYLNYFEHLAIQEMSLRKHDWETWLSIMEDVFESSPIIKKVYVEKLNWYAPVLHELVHKSKKIKLDV